MVAGAAIWPPPPASSLRRPVRLRSKLELTSHPPAGDESFRLCTCGRRHFVGALGSATLLSPSSSLAASGRSRQTSDSLEVVNKFHQARPEWYEEFYASQMDQGMRFYEDEIADYKVQLFGDLNKEAKNVLELGIGTGPNLKFYAKSAGIHVIGIDPNRQMEKYSRAASIAAGLPMAQFQFMQGVAEALPVPDESMDIVVGTLVLCSVKDVNLALKELKRVLKPKGMYIFIEHVAAHDGTLLRIVQNVLDPLQQFVADGCHLARETGREISSAGFSYLNLNRTSISKASLISPHVYGMAMK